MNVPKLRFKEFSGEWEITCLKDVITRINRVSDDFAPSMMITADSGFVLQSEKYSKDMTGESLKKYITLFKGELAYNHGASKLRPYGSTFVLNEERAKVPFVYHCFAINKGITDFYGLYLNRWEFGKKLKPLISSSARLDGLLNISFESFTNIKVNTPNFTEQEKIADFLNLVGEKINIQKDIVVSLEKQKKGLMQKIFSQKLRFKDDKGEEFPDWEEKKLGEVGSFTKGGSLSKADLSDDGIECVLYGELYTRYSEIAEKIVSKTNVDEIVLCMSRKNDVILPSSGETPEDISTATCILKDGVALGGDIIVYRSELLDGRFNSYLLNHKCKMDIARIAQGKSVVHINANALKNILVLVPCLEEQNKIVEFLFSMNKMIENAIETLEHWKQIKKGLLQQMFV